VPSAARTASELALTVYERKISAVYQFHCTSTVSSPGTKSKSGCRPPRWRLVFCSYRDYFIVTRNFTAVYLDLIPLLSFTVTRSAQPSTGTGKKQGTATQTAPNQTAGPLYVRFLATHGSFKRTNRISLSPKYKNK